MAPNFITKNEIYRDYEISWVEPPMMSSSWVANVASNFEQLQKSIGISAKVITASTREAMLIEAKKYIDSLVNVP